MDKETKLKYRAVIEFLVKEGKQPKEIFERMAAVYGDNAPSNSMVKKWAAEFLRGRASLGDDPRPGRPVDVTTPENIAAVEKLVMADRRLKVREIATEMRMSEPSVLAILHDHLKMSKVCARWVPRMLQPKQKTERVRCSREILQQFQRNPDNFLSRLVTGDETWIHHYDPESKQESMQWKHSSSPPPTKFRVHASAGKVMATIFWDAKGILLIDYLPPKTTITGVYYSNLLVKLREAIKSKRRGMLARGVLLLHDNAPVHTAAVAQAAILKCGFTVLPHPPYSPDLAPSDFHLFPELKKHLRGTRFSDNDELQDAVEGFFEEKQEDFFLKGIQALEHRCDKCVVIGGDYIEKV